MALKFVTSVPGFAGLGRTLEPDEIDNNFYELLAQLNSLVANPVQPLQIVSISLDGSSLTFTMSDGSTFGPLFFPTPELHWRDEWTPSTFYQTMDIFKVTGVGLYFVQIDHVSGTTFDKTITSSGNPVLLEMFQFALFGVVTTQVASAYNLVLTDADGWIRVSDPVAALVTIPLESTISFPLGTTVAFEQLDAGAITVAGAAGVTLNCAATHTPVSGGQFAVMQIKKVAADEWTIFGNLVPA